MCGIICGVTTTIIGVVLVVVSTVLTFVFVPGVIEDLIINVSRYILHNLTTATPSTAN